MYRGHEQNNAGNHETTAGLNLRLDRLGLRNGNITSFPLGKKTPLLEP